MNRSALRTAILVALRDGPISVQDLATMLDSPDAPQPRIAWTLAHLAASGRVRRIALGRSGVLWKLVDT